MSSPIKITNMATSAESQPSQKIRKTRAQKRDERKQRQLQKKLASSMMNNEQIKYILKQAQSMCAQTKFPISFTLKAGKIVYIIRKPVKFGCPESTDADIAVELKYNDLNLLNEKTCSDLNQKQIERELLPIVYKYIELSQQQGELDFDGKEVDLCCFEINYEKHEICWGSKGTNINLQFYLHFTSTKEFNRLLKCPSIQDIDKPTQMLQPCKIILKKLEDIVNNRLLYVNHFREKKKVCFANGNETIAEYGLELISHFKIMPHTRHNTILISLWKNLTMKIIQSYLIDKEFNGNMYTKSAMIKQFSIHYPSHSDGVRILLLRELNNPDIEIPYETIDLLINLCRKLIEKHVYPPDPVKVIDVSDCFNTTCLDPRLINEFKKSPQHPTDRFCKIFSNSYDAENLNKAFMAPCTNINCLSQELKSRVYTVAPKSPEWSCLLSQHDCGRNSGVIPIPPGLSSCDKVAFRYNLIRGCIGEDIATYYIKKNCLYDIVGMLYITVIVGLIVESKRYIGSRGCAPDIIIKTFLGKLIPIEIKTIYGTPTRNSHFTRAMYLATRQVQTCNDLIGDQMWLMVYECVCKLLIPCMIGYVINNIFVSVLVMLYTGYVLYNQYKTLDISGLIVLVWVHESQILMEVFTHV